MYFGLLLAYLEAMIIIRQSDHMLSAFFSLLWHAIKKLPWRRRNFGVGGGDSKAACKIPIEISKVDDFEVLL